MKTPDITPQAIGAFVILAFTNVMILWGIDIGDKREAALETLINGSAVIGFLFHDMWIRAHRAKIEAARLLSKAPGQTVTLKV